MLAGPGADHVQRPLGTAAVEGTADGLAIDRHDLALDAITKQAGPGREAGLERVRVDEHEHPPEGIVRRDAVGQGKEGLEPRANA